jgi:phospholipid N-methyltransferase
VSAPHRRFPRRRATGQPRRAGQAVGAHEAARPDRSDASRFLRAFLRDPLHTAAIAPSSPHLAAAMAADVPSRGEPTVVELGAGTGALTTALQHRLAGRGRHLAIERNGPWAELLRRRYPQVEVVHADVADLVDVLAERNVADVDTVVSGLPWAAYREQLPAAVAAALAPTGVFTEFAYSWSRRWAPPARAELAMLRRHFAHVAVSPTIWRNLPPAVVYRARRPITAQAR